MFLPRGDFWRLSTASVLLAVMVALIGRSALADPPAQGPPRYDFGMGGSGDRALRSAKAQLRASLNDLDSVHQFQIIFYNERPRIFNPTGQAGRLAFANATNKGAAQRFIDSLEAEGGTRHDDAVAMAIRLHPDVIYWLTDADEPKLGPRDIARISRLAAGIAIHTIEFGSGPSADADNFLVQIARETGGRHVYVDVSQKAGAERQ